MNTPSQGLAPGTSLGEIVLGGGPDPLRFLWTVTQSRKRAPAGCTCCSEDRAAITYELRLGPEVLGPLGASPEDFELLQTFLRRAVECWPAPAPPLAAGEYDRVIWKAAVPELDLSVRTSMASGAATVQLGRTSANFQRDDFLRWARSVAECLELLGVP